MSQPTHYEVLALPQSLLEESKDDQIPILLKQAYHRALLRHHPDKALKPNSSLTDPPSSITTTTSQPTYTIDQITTAYTTLISSRLRSEYNVYLRGLPTNTTSSTPSAFQTGIETLDLDDLASDDSVATGETTWFNPCRCGNERGFVFSEADLEEAGDLGELIVGCQDCSLWLRVCFAVVDDEDDVASGVGRQDSEGQDEVEVKFKGGGVTGEGQESGRAPEAGPRKGSSSQDETDIWTTVR